MQPPAMRASSLQMTRILASMEARVQGRHPFGFHRPHRSAHGEQSACWHFVELLPRLRSAALMLSQGPTHGGGLMVPFHGVPPDTSFIVVQLALVASVLMLSGAYRSYRIDFRERSLSEANSSGH